MSNSTDHRPNTLGTDAAVGYCLLRVTMGINFLFHSYTRWIDMDKFVGAVVHDFVHSPLPLWSVRAFAWAIPFWEPLAGLLITLGLWTRASLAAGALLIVFLVFGMALRGQYPVLSEQLIYALVFFLLIDLRAEHNRYGVDGWLAGKLFPTAE